VFLDQVGATEKDNDKSDKSPDDQCSGREAPPLEVPDYRNSLRFVQQMITPPPRFNVLVVLWSNLRVLTLAPRDKEQPSLDRRETHLSNYISLVQIWANVSVMFFLVT
jgi:hypothetical protein